MFVVGTFVPASAHASLLGDIIAALKLYTPAEASALPSKDNVQTMALLKPAMNIDPAAGRGGGDIIIVDDSALLPSEGPSGTIADIEKPKNGTISIYIVREGDTLSGIAKLFDVTPNTILWANDLSSASKLRVGQSLVILPVTGVKYTVKKGDTLASIAKKFGADAEEVSNYNALEGATLAIGTELIIPDGEIAVTSKNGATASQPARSVESAGTSSQIGYYMAPLARYTRTQGIHGYNAVDFAAPIGTPVVASASGDVTIARDSGWNGGYGSYVVVSHDNGSQTLYSHLSQIATYDGARVVQGQVIGYVGRTGKATGPHLHFEIRSGIRNPF